MMTTDAPTVTDKVYTVGCTVLGDCSSPPSCATYTIDRPLATRIIMLAGLVRHHSLATVTERCERAEFLQYDPKRDPSMAAELGADNGVRTENDVLVVTNDTFYFQGRIRHTDVVVTSQRSGLRGLARNFGLIIPSRNPTLVQPD